MIELIDESRSKASKKIDKLLNGKFYKRKEIAEILGMSYRTFWTRKRDNTWTAKEIAIINEL